MAVYLCRASTTICYLGLHSGIFLVELLVSLHIMLTLLVSTWASIYCQVSSKLELGLGEGCHEMLETALCCAENDAVLKISQTQTQSVRFNAVLAAAVSTR